MSLLKALSIAIASLSMATAGRATDLPPAEIKILGWPRMSVADFGCVMERTFGHRDARFNCDLKNYTNQGDPCVKTAMYYEGPQFPEKLASAVHPLATAVRLDFEGGKVRGVDVHLRGKFAEKDILKAFSVPSDRLQLPPNVQSASAGPDCSLVGSCIGLTGFDHQGAGDVDCSEKPTRKR
jgi:hypothetical protein